MIVLSRICHARGDINKYREHGKRRHTVTLSLSYDYMHVVCVCGGGSTSVVLYSTPWRLPWFHPYKAANIRVP